MANLLVIDDDHLFRVYISKLLKANSHTVCSVGTGKQAIVALEKEAFDLVFCEYKLPDIRAIEILDKVDGRIPVIMITGHASIPTAVELIKSGACNYLVKPVLSDVLLKEVDTTLEKYRSTEQGKDWAGVRTGDLVTDPTFETMLHTKGYVTGSTDHAEQIRRQIRRVAPTNYSVIIQGESGTGKEITALAIHLQSKRRAKPFVAVDCGVLTPELARSELFGYEKGAFTGATHAKKGQFQLANGGTLFLDEIGNLPHEVQGYFLRAIQEGVVYPVGSQLPVQTDVRIVVASNVDLKNSVKKKVFRDDLFHRLNEYSILLKPLREQKEDIMPFANHFLQRVKDELDIEKMQFGEGVEEVFTRYSWPGNIRELKNTIRRACLLADDEWILPEHLMPEILEERSVEGEPTPAPAGSNSNLKAAKAHSERDEIKQALKKANFNKSKAARNLGIDRKTLYNKIEKYGLEA